MCAQPYWVYWITLDNSQSTTDFYSTLTTRKNHDCVLWMKAFPAAFHELDSADMGICGTILALLYMVPQKVSDFINPDSGFALCGRR